MIVYDFLEFSFIDLIDVLVVSAIIYQVLKLTRGTRSAQIVVGFSLIAVIAFIAFYFQLEGLTWLFSNLTVYGIIVLVVVFQPELRGALPKHRRIWESQEYWVPMFDAVALAITWLNQQQ